MRTGTVQCKTALGAKRGNRWRNAQWSRHKSAALRRENARRWRLAFLSGNCRSYGRPWRASGASLRKRSRPPCQSEAARIATERPLPRGCVGDGCNRRAVAPPLPASLRAFLCAPLLLGLAPHSRRVRVLELEPVAASGRKRSASPAASRRCPRAPSCRRARNTTSPGCVEMLVQPQSRQASRAAGWRASPCASRIGSRRRSSPSSSSRSKA